MPLNFRLAANSSLLHLAYTIVKESPYPLRYMPQLDSLRALAALGVFAQHFLAPSSLFASKVPLGDLGVRLFFVLSGYLITSILLNSRHQVSLGAINASTVVKHFYARRFLRLMPVYFLFLTVAFYFMPEVREHAWWFYSYLQNIHYAAQGEFTFAGHVWTLAVEEQFYLIWPFLALLTPKRFLLPTMVSVVVLGVMARLFFLGIGLNHFQASMLTPSHFDTLGIGAVLAVLSNSKRYVPKRVRRMLNVAFVLGLALLSVVLIAKLLGWPSTVEFILGELGAGLLFVWLIARAAKGFSGGIGVVLEHPVLVYLGKISYGMYVYHLFVPSIVGAVLPMTGLVLPALDWGQWFIYSVLSILLAMLSWHAMEKPILQLKRFFSYQTKPAV